MLHHITGWSVLHLLPSEGLPLRLGEQQWLLPGPLGAQLDHLHEAQSLTAFGCVWRMRLRIYAAQISPGPGSQAGRPYPSGGAASRVGPVVLSTRVYTACSNYR